MVKTRFYWTGLLCSMLLAWGCAGAPQRRDERQAGIPTRRPASAVDALRSELEYLFNDPSFGNAHWGVFIKSLDNGQILYTRNEQKGFMPASNMKIFSTAVALARLGPDFRYETQLLSTDPRVQDGVINGDLYVVGSGDPSFAARFHDDNPLAPLEAWAQTLKAQGITRVEGDLIGDDDLFDDQYIAESWSYGYLSDWYAAESGALCLNDNCYDVYVSPGSATGAPVHVRTVPPNVYGEFVVSATTASPGTRGRIRVGRQVDTNTFTIRGRLPLGDEETKQYVSVHNPTLFFVSVLKDVLENAGIEVAGEPRDIDDLDKRRYDTSKMALLAQYDSVPLSEIIKAVNKPSQNLYADQLLKTLGARFGERGSFAQGCEVVKAFLDEQGVDSNGLAMTDGSGLARTDLVQPRQTAGLLEVMYRHPHFPYFFESLPIAGVDGTIRSRMKGTRAEGNVHAKTGYISRVRCLSGYVTTLDGEMLLFCLMANNYTVPTALANRLQDQVCERLANFSRKPS